MTANWVWNDKTKTYDVGGTCHTGNTAIYTEKNGGTLFIGGWHNAAVVTSNTHVIDLTGTEHKFYAMPEAFDTTSMDFMEFIQTPCAGWLSLPFPDYGTPKNLSTKAQWEGIAKTIKKILKSKKDVLVACAGGHGRSGLFCSIVGYILGVNANRAWASPVEHIRKIHCDSAVETYGQEKYVYDILGLNIEISHVYAAPTNATENCPICHNPSKFIADFGMCFNCKTIHEKTAPVKYDLTVEDLDNPVPHTCDAGKNCLGIYTAEKCKHTVHDMLINDGLCETCQWEENQKAKIANQATHHSDVEYGKCAMCKRESFYGRDFGICWDCSEELKKSGAADYVHDSILDGYKAVPHSCDSDVACLGVVIADVCKHAIHNRDVMDGLCPICFEKKEEYKNGLQNNQIS